MEGGALRDDSVPKGLADCSANASDLPPLAWANADNRLPKSSERFSPTSACGPPTSTVRPPNPLPRNQLAMAPARPVAAGGTPVCQGPARCAPTTPDLLHFFLLTAVSGASDTPLIPGTRADLGCWGGPRAAGRPAARSPRGPQKQIPITSPHLSPRTTWPRTRGDAWGWSQCDERIRDIRGRGRFCREVR